ncbi:MAG: hypothetical protein NWS46_02210 [Cyclobacteriaceae bacterium]|nr:hypothetical protein [Cyclobacteriaceae bacterium]
MNPELLALITKYGQMVSSGLVGLGVLVLLGHLIKLMITNEYKAKYDYINMYEIKYLWLASVLLIIAGAIFTNTLVTESGMISFFVRLFVSVMFAIIVGVVVQNILKFYYPFYIEKRLKFLRYEPRVSPDGRKMKLLSEEEEDIYLDEGMQAEENAFSIDYDVWIDEVSRYTHIEKYNGRLTALKCSECNYQTLKVTNEEIIQSPTIEEEGELMKHYTCGYCGHKERKSFSIAKIRQSEPA